MTRNRYWDLSRNFHIVDNTLAVTDKNNPKYDPLFKVRPMIDLVNDRCGALYKPKQHICVDEAIIKYKGRHIAKQYLPKKPNKWGFKVWVCAESASGYALQFEVYDGKPRNLDRIQTRKQYGAQFDVVEHLTRNYQEKNHVVTYDRFFSSVALAEHLLEKKTYVNSTVMLNRKGLPPQVKKMKLSKGAACHQYRKGNSNLMLTVFYHKRQVAHLSTGSQPGLDNISTKPKVNRDYNRYMGGVDLCDQLMSYYAVGRKGRKYWRYIAWYLFSLAINNARILWLASTPPELALDEGTKRNKMTFKQFRLEVIRSLLSGFSRCSTIKRVFSTAETLQPLLTLEEAILHTAVKDTLKLCQYCLEKGKKGPNGGQIRSSTMCQDCKIALCPHVCFQLFHAERCGIFK
jgi:hypothetical protein